VTEPADTDVLVDLDPSTVEAPLEALLMMASEPMPLGELALALRAPKPVVWAALENLQRFYEQTGRGFELREVGQGWRYYTRPEHAELIGAWVLEGQHAKLSQAALETLAVVAYKQPISRSRVSAVRGVNVDGVMRTLVTRGLIEEAGPHADTGAMTFRTTDTFLERMGITSLLDLPPLAPHLPEASALEAELAGLSEVAPGSATGEDGAMSDNTEIPSSEKVHAWADAEAAASTRDDEAGAQADDVPAADELDRLSDES